ncbi:Uncharacterised protein [Klebsiella pneumoniae]|nr:Uncharacterised protein [Klebsiella pneumoniae]STT63614.1 Uncharacterised protein [Klebsiella pneumoniae]
MLSDDLARYGAVTMWVFAVYEKSLASPFINLLIKYKNLLKNMRSEQFEGGGKLGVCKNEHMKRMYGNVGGGG